MASDEKLPSDGRLGLVAGRGEFPLEVCRGAREAGVDYIGVVAVTGDGSGDLADLADRLDWAYPGQVGKVIRFFRQQDISNVVFAGQIRPGRLFTGLRPDLRALRLLSGLRERNAETIFSAVAHEFEKSGIHVLPSTITMPRSLASEGVLGSVRPRKAQLADVDLGVRVAREISGLDIGQTVVVKRGTVLAVEAFEGTDRAILRGGEVGHGGVVVVKVAKAHHDLRFDVPCVGMRTVASLSEAKASVLAVQSGMTLLIEREAVVTALNAKKVALLGVEIPD